VFVGGVLAAAFRFLVGVRRRSRAVRRARVATALGMFLDRSTGGSVYY
jgi:hypothetical protein